MIRAVRTLRKHSEGATVVEFALVAPMLLVFVFGLMEGARAIWTFQTLQETAFASARCLVIGRSPCDSTANAKNYAVSRAAQYRLTVPLSAVIAEKGVTCDGVSGQGRVQIALPYTVVLGDFINMDIDTLTARACMPVPPSS